MKAENIDEILKILHRYGKYIFVTDEKRYSDMVNEIANLKVLEQEPKWVKCSDNLPDMDDDVLGTRKEYGDVVIVTRTKSYINGAGWEWVISDDVEGNSYQPDEIIAWMPLPDGYKESEE